MITTLDKIQLVELGVRMRGGHLLQQANYTLELARRDPEVVALLPRGFMEEADKALRQVEKGLRDVANIVAESRDATRTQNDTLRRVREWRRKLAALGRMAARMGAPVPAPLLTIGDSVRDVPAALVTLQQSVALLKEHAATFEPFPLYRQVLGEAENYAVSLAAVDAAQETKSLVDRPAAVRNYYVAKGALYIALKIVNDTARAVHAGDPVTASQFNLSILYRGNGRRPRPIPVTPPETPSPS